MENETNTGDGAGDHILTMPSESVLAMVDPQLLKRHWVILVRCPSKESCYKHNREYHDKKPVSSE